MIFGGLAPHTRFLNLCLSTVTVAGGHDHAGCEAVRKYPSLVKYRPHMII